MHLLRSASRCSETNPHAITKAKLEPFAESCATLDGSLSTTKQSTVTLIFACVPRRTMHEKDGVATSALRAKRTRVACAEDDHPNTGTNVHSTGTLHAYTEFTTPLQHASLVALPTCCVIALETDPSGSMQARTASPLYLKDRPMLRREIEANAHPTPLPFILKRWGATNARGKTEAHVTHSQLWGAETVAERRLKAPCASQTKIPSVPPPSRTENICCYAAQRAPRRREFSDGPPPQPHRQARAHLL